MTTGVTDPLRSMDRLASKHDNVQPADSDNDLAHLIAKLRSDLTSEIRKIVERQNTELLQEHQSLKPLLSVGDVAETLGIGKRTVEKIISEGDLQPIWVRGQRRFHPDAVEAYMRRQARGQSK